MKVFVIIFLILSIIGIINDCCYACYLAKNNPEKYKETETGLIVRVIIKGFFLVSCVLIIKMS